MKICFEDNNHNHNNNDRSRELLTQPTRLSPYIPRIFPGGYKGVARS